MNCCSKNFLIDQRYEALRKLNANLKMLKVLMIIPSRKPTKQLVHQ